MANSRCAAARDLPLDMDRSWDGDAGARVAAANSISAAARSFGQSDGSGEIPAKAVKSLCAHGTGQAGAAGPFGHGQPQPSPPFLAVRVSVAAATITGLLGRIATAAKGWPAFAKKGARPNLTDGAAVAAAEPTARQGASAKYDQPPETVALEVQRDTARRVVGIPRVLYRRPIGAMA